MHGARTLQQGEKYRTPLIIIRMNQVYYKFRCNIGLDYGFVEGGSREVCNKQIKREKGELISSVSFWIWSNKLFAHHVKLCNNSLPHMLWYDWTVWF